MDEKIIKEKIKIAHELASNESEPYKIEVFKIMLKKLLEEDSVSFNTKGKIKPQKITSSSPNTKKQQFAVNCKITSEELDNVIAIDNEKIEVFAIIEGSTAIKQKNTALILLASLEFFFEKDWVSNRELSEMLQSKGIHDRGSHLAGNLKKHVELFRIKGKKPHFEYKITIPGRQLAYEIIKKLAKGEPLEN